MSRPPSAELIADLAASPYEPVRTLAVGGMGEVYIVRHRGFGHEAVMKLTKHTSEEQGEDLTRRLLREGRVLKSLEHVAIVGVLDLGFTLSKRAYLVTEWISGTTLKEEVRVNGPLPVPLAIEICVAMLGALQFAHDAGVVHRDIKPDNVMLTAPNEAGERFTKVLDFGVVKILGSQMKERVGGIVATQQGMLVGTPAYASPEQIAAKDIDGRTDLYAVGGVLFYLLTARPPFVGIDVNDVFVAHLTQPADPPSRIRREVSPALDAVVLRALAKDPADRFASANDMLLALQETARSASTAYAKTELLDAQTIPIDKKQLEEMAASARRAAEPSNEDSEDRFQPPMSTGSIKALVAKVAASESPPVASRPPARTLALSPAAAPRRTARGTVIGADPPPVPAPTQVPPASLRVRLRPRSVGLLVLLGIVLGAITIGLLQLSGVFR